MRFVFDVCDDTVFAVAATAAAAAAVWFSLLREKAKFGAFTVDSTPRVLSR